jgi:hypothetical protein
VKTDVGSKADKWVYNTPCCGELASVPQAGASVPLRAAGSHRVLNLVQTGRHLHGVLGSGPCTHDCGAQGTDTNNLMIYVDLDCSDPKSLRGARHGEDRGARRPPIFGTVGVDSQGNVGILAMSSTASTDLQHPRVVAQGGRDRPRLHGPDRRRQGHAAPHLHARPEDGPSGQHRRHSYPAGPQGRPKLWTSLQWSNDAAPCVFNTRIVAYQLAEKPSKELRPKSPPPTRRP